jgi:hypothetical protein
MLLTQQRYSTKLSIALVLLIVSFLTWVPMQPYPLRQALPAKETVANSLPTNSPALKDITKVSSSASTFTPTESDKTIQARVSKEYGKLPLSFEENLGQVDDAVKFLSRGCGFSLFLTSTEAVLTMSKPDTVKTRHAQVRGHHRAKARHGNSREAVLRMKLVGANPEAEVRGVDEQSGKSNYFIGNDSAKWRTNVAHYARVQYRDVYAGVDLIYYGNGRQLEYDFVVAPRADPDVIKLAFNGASGMKLNTDGSLLLRMSGGEVRQHKPIIYQTVNGERKEIASRYVIKGKRKVGFEIADYDRNQPLVIDPVLSYSSYLGGSGDDMGFGIAVDSAGNAYVTGFTTSNNFPTVNSLSPGNDFRDVFVTKVNAAGTALVYSTYIGGNNFERGQSIAVDSSGNAYVTGRTQSANFPTATPIQSALGGSEDAFVTKLNPNGSALVYSTYLGGSGPEDGRGIVIDSAGSAYVTGQTDSPNFPTNANSFQPIFGGSRFGGDAFVTKLSPAGSALIYSTFLGGYDYDDGNAIAVDSSGNAYITGATHSPNFPTANAFLSTIQSFCSGLGSPIAPCFDAFVTKLNPSGSALVYSTFLGGYARDEGHAIAVDSSGNIYVAGETSSNNFPTANAFQPTRGPSDPAFNPASDAFITKFNPAGSALVYSTFLGGSIHGEHLGGMAIDAQGNAYVTGQTIASDFPTADPLQPIGGGGDAFVTKLSATGSSLVYSTYFGGSNYDESHAIALDTAGNAYITGRTWGDFPTQKPFQPVFGGGANLGEGDAFVAKIGNNNVPTPTVFSISAVTPNKGGNTGTVSITIHGSGFKSGATVKLVRAGQPDIIAATVGVSADSTIARARFDLVGHSPGVRDVVLTNPDGRSVTGAGAFNVEASGRTQMWVDIIGRDEFRPGRPQTYYIAYGNRGNIDEMLVPLVVAIPKEAQYELGFELLEPPQPVAGETYDFSRIPPHYETDTEKIIPLLIGIVPAGSSNFLKIKVTGGNQPLRLVARVSLPVLPTVVASPSSSAILTDSFYMNHLVRLNGAQSCLTNYVIGRTGCLGTIYNATRSCIEGAKPLPTNCLPAIAAYAEASTCQAVTTGIDQLTGNEPTTTSAVLSVTQSAVGAVGVAASCSGGVATPVGQAIAAINCGFGANDILSGCLGVDLIGQAQKFVRAVLSLDPNDKIGSAGAGVDHYLSGEEPLRYSIYFENVESATAPAQDIVITDQLDASKLDFDTFSLGPISFGVDKVVVPPPGLSEFTTDVDLRPQKNLIVRVEARLDKTTGLLTWRFTSLDPATGQPTEDPTAGFLPPNRSAPEGEGQVLFTVQPREGVATGTEIRNRARIVFDANPFIDTPEWLNTIDNAKPTSRVLTLPATQCTTGINLQWSGNDEGSGISDFTILVSDNGEPPVPLMSNTTATSTSFQGQIGHTYAFYSVARDNTGNLEEPHASPDATVSIVAVAPPTITAPPAVSVTTGINAASCGAFISDATLGAAMARSNCSGVTVTRDGVPADHFFPVGSTTITYTATDGAGNTSTARQRVTVTDQTPPKVSDVTVDKPSLWPANHKMIDVALNYTAVDNCGQLTCQINITSNEPINGTGDGDTSPDWEILDLHHVRLRAERSGKGKGRVYLIKITCTDSSGNSTSRTVAVTVPHNQK